MAIILVIAGIIWCPRRLKNQLPKEKIISITVEYEKYTIDGVEKATAEIAQDKIPEFEEKLNSFWYINYIDFCKCYISSPEIYTITYENYTVVLGEYRLSVYNHQTKESIGPGNIYQIYPMSVYSELKGLFLI